MDDDFEISDDSMDVMPVHEKEHKQVEKQNKPIRKPTKKEWTNG